MGYTPAITSPEPKRIDEQLPRNYFADEQPCGHLHLYLSLWRTIIRRGTLIFAAALLYLTSCVSTERTLLLTDTTGSVDVAGVDGQSVRIWGDASSSEMEEYLTEHTKNAAEIDSRNGNVRSGVENFLVLSGGGQNGAYGAGLLNGWTKSGTRPQFRIVTGVSTGALIAPFAFLGSGYDHLLKTFYTNHSTSDIVKPTVLSGLLGGSSVTDSKPLAKLIEIYITNKVLREIAAEYEKGRYLLIGTTNLDAGRPVIWNMGEIAQLGNSRGAALFRSVILASASIPGAFPPVLIDVNSQGKQGKEMHVDGGTTDNAILVPFQINLKKLTSHLKRQPKRRMFVLINSSLNPKWKAVKSSTFSIAGRSIDTLIKQQTISDVHRLYAFSRRNKVEFNLTGIPSDFNEQADELFDQKYMKKLFDRGFELASNGYKWIKKPPGV